MSTVVKIDSRVCVKQMENGFNIDRQDVSVPDAIEIMERITYFIRARDFVTPMIAGEVIDSFEIYPDEPIETPKVCIAFSILRHTTSSDEPDFPALERQVQRRIQHGRIFIDDDI